MQFLKVNTRSCQGLIVQPHFIRDAFHAGPVDRRPVRCGGQAQNCAFRSHVQARCPGACEVRQHQQSGRFIFAVSGLHGLVGFTFPEGIQAPADQRASRAGECVCHILPCHGVRHRAEGSPAHDRKIRQAVVYRRQAFGGSGAVHRHAPVERAGADRRGYLVMAHGNNPAFRAQAGLLRNFR